jgi:hypothetical protein
MAISRDCALAREKRGAAGGRPEGTAMSGGRTKIRKNSKNSAERYFNFIKKLVNYVTYGERFPL